MSPEEARLGLRDGGYDPIPVNGKIPVLKAWQTRQDTTRDEIAFWSRTHPAAENTGVLTRLTPTLDLDILDPDAADAVEDLVRNRFGERGRILVRFGARPKRAIVFRTNAPFAKIAVNFVVVDGAQSEKIEFLGDGQQVVVDGVHPATGRRYEWFGGSPLDIKLADLPAIAAEEAQAILDDLAKLLVEKFGYRLPSASVAAGDGDDSGGVTDWVIDLDDWMDHDKCVALAMRLLRSGMRAGAAVNFLRANVEALANVDEERRGRRLREIVTMVRSAQEKLKAERSPPGADDRAGREAEVFRLATLTDLQYEEERIQAAERLRIRVGVLDRIVSKVRGNGGDEGAVLYEHWAVQPWGELVDGGICCAR
jgi:hypothetical protein